MKYLIHRGEKYYCVLQSSAFPLLLLFFIKMNFNNILVNFAGSLYNPHSKDSNVLIPLVV
jgi:hypothetical protein